jgi:hypothetical protein
MPLAEDATAPAESGDSPNVRPVLPVSDRHQ